MNADAPPIAADEIMVMEMKKIMKLKRSSATSQFATMQSIKLLSAAIGGASAFIGVSKDLCSHPSPHHA